MTSHVPDEKTEVIDLPASVRSEALRAAVRIIEDVGGAPIGTVLRIADIFAVWIATGRRDG